jgi:hypothetical protein
MKNGLIIIGFAVSVLLVGGCFIFEDDEAYDGGASADTTIAEIDAVGELSFGSERKDAYKRIAKREGISPVAQVYLVEAVLDNLSRDDAKQEVLLTLIKNPSFSSVAEHEILNDIDQLAFESTKQEILEAISDLKN